MKKIFLFILPFLVIISLSACKGNDTIVEVDEFDIFKEVIDGYTIDQTNGVTVDVEQFLGGKVIHKQHIIQRIDRSGEFLAKTEYYERAIGPFNIEEEYVVTEATTYYQNGQMITDAEGENLVYEEILLENYIDSALILKGLTKDNFVSYNIQTLGKLQVLTGVLTIGSVRSIFGTDISMVESNEITIIINEEDKTFVEFAFHYTSEQTETTFTFTPFYDEVEITLPTEE